MLRTRTVSEELRRTREDRFVLSVVKTNVFLQDMNDFAVMNEVYAQGKSHLSLSLSINTLENLVEVFSERHPARSTVQVAGLPRVILSLSISLHW